MASLISPVEKLDNLYLEHLPSGKPINVSKAVRVGGITLFVTDKGRIYTDSLKSYCYCAGDWPWVDPLMKALLRLGVITKSQMDEHISWNKAVVEKKNKKHAAEFFVENARELGITITKGQLKKIRSANET